MERWKDSGWEGAQRTSKPAGRAGKQDGDADDIIALTDEFSSEANRFKGLGDPELEKMFGIGQPTHGDNVQYVVQKAGVSASAIRKLDTAGDSTGDIGEPLKSRIENKVAALLDSSSKSMDSVLQNPGRIGVINESRGVTKARILGEQWGRREYDNGGSGRLVQELGLPKDATDKQILQALTKTLDEVFEKSDKIRTARANYLSKSAELEKQGILHVIATGNDRDTLKLLDKEGIPYGKDYTLSVLTTDKTINVSASTGDAPGEMASFSNGGKHVSLAADGMDIEVGPGQKANGTSFAAPQVSAVVAQIRQRHPKLTNDEVRDILRRSSQDTSAPAELEGAGVLDPARAKQLAAEVELKRGMRIIRP